jgi:hypothetical protein
MKWRISFGFFVAVAIGCGGASTVDLGAGNPVAVDGGGAADASTQGDGAGGPSDAGSTSPDDPLNAPATCTSNRTWTGGDRGSGSMHPGGACITCHTTRRGAPQFTIAGTVYPSGHEPTDCNGAPGTGVVVEITDSNANVMNLTPNAVGNFYSTAAFAFPVTAKVKYQGKERAMVTPQASGDCNSCHTATGTNGAPGRITLPY